MNPLRNPLCTRNGGPSFGTTSGHGIRGYQISTAKFLTRATKKGTWMRPGQLDGKLVGSQSEADRLGVLHGILVRHGRNSGSFVQSRAARKRGYVATDWRYLRNAARGASKLQ